MSKQQEEEARPMRFSKRLMSKQQEKDARPMRVSKRSMSKQQEKDARRMKEKLVAAWPEEGEASGPLAFTQPSHEPMESQSYVLGPELQLPPPVQLESECHAPPLKFKCYPPEPEWVPKFDDPPQLNVYRTPSWEESLLGSECPLEFECPPPSPPHSPQHGYHPHLKCKVKCPTSSPPFPPVPVPVPGSMWEYPLPILPEEPLQSKCYSPPLTTTALERATTASEKLSASLKTFKFYSQTDLFAQTALHCYNLHRGENLQFLNVRRSLRHGLYGLYMLVEAEHPIDKSTCYVDTSICSLRSYHKKSMDLTVMHCRLHPEVEGSRSCYERLGVDELFKADMPNWMPEDALTGSYKRQYYEMKESEVEQNKEWLHLYAQLALYALENFPGETGPFELRKIVVQTTEDVEPKKKAKARNAIFYISGGQDRKAIIRRTMESCEHMFLEVKNVGWVAA